MDKSSESSLYFTISKVANTLSQRTLSVVMCTWKRPGIQSGTAAVRACNYPWGQGGILKMAMEWNYYNTTNKLTSCMLSRNVRCVCSCTMFLRMGEKLSNVMLHYHITGSILCSPVWTITTTSVMVVYAFGDPSANGYVRWPLILDLRQGWVEWNLVS